MSDLALSLKLLFVNQLFVFAVFHIQALPVQFILLPERQDK